MISKIAHVTSVIILFILVMFFPACGLVYTIDGTYYYSPWGASIDSNGCMGVDSNSDGRKDMSVRYTLELKTENMTYTKESFSDTLCATLDSTIISQSTYTTGAYISSKRIYYDSSADEYKTWSDEPVQALAMDITYVSSALTCKSDSCVIAYSSLAKLNSCENGSLTVDQEYDYTACEFKDQPATLYSLVYKNNFNEIVFGAKYVLTTDSVTEYAGDSDANRYKYLLVNFRYSQK